MTRDILVAFVSAATGACTVPALVKLKEWVCPPKKKWEPFEPGVCDELPLHDWFWESDPEGFRCEKCTSVLGKDQPPYCAERGGHYHFKCSLCGYEWAMCPYSRKPEKGATARPVPGSGAP